MAMSRKVSRKKRRASTRRYHLADDSIANGDEFELEDWMIGQPNG